MSPPNATKNAKKASHAPPYLVSYQASKLRHAGAPPARRAARWLRPRAAARRPFAPPRATWRWRTPGRSCASGRGTTRSSGEIRRPAPPARVARATALPARLPSTLQPTSRCSRPGVRTAGSTHVPGSQPSPRCGVAARSRPPACPHPFVAGWASCCAGRAGPRRCRPPCTRCTRRSSCTRARSASDRRIASRRHAAAVDTCHRTHGHAWAPQPSACQAYRLPGRAALQAPRPLTRPEH